MNSAKIKRLFTHDWEAKLICLVLAMLLWWVVKDQIERSTPALPKLEMPQLPEGWPLLTPSPPQTPVPVPIPNPPTPVPTPSPARPDAPLPRPPVDTAE